MDRSKYSNIIATTRLLPHFSSQNINKFKSCIFEQLGCKNESQFICKALKSLYKTISVESITIIKNTAIEIADTQPSTHTTLHFDAEGNAKDNKDNHITVHKYIHSQYNDPLSRLHSDIIDYFGTFLNKKQSIEIGYLNKQLYIETQKHSYLLKRCKDDAFILDDQKMSKLLQSQSNAFNYSFPKDLTLRLRNISYVSKLLNFNLFFRGLKILQCTNFSSLSCIPCEIFFDSGMNRYHVLDKFTLKLYFPPAPNDSIETINKFCVKFDGYKDSSDRIGCIKEFELHVDRWLTTDDDGARAARVQRATKQLIMRLGNICQSMRLYKTKIVISTIDELQTIFHPNLKHLYLSRFATIVFKEIGTKSIVNHMNKCNKMAKIENIGVHLESEVNGDTNQRTIKTFNALDTFMLRKCVKCYTIHLHATSGVIYFRDNNNDSNDKFNVYDDKLDILDKIFFQDYDKHPLLEKIKVKFYDTCDLNIFASYCYILIIIMINYLLKENCI